MNRTRQTELFTVTAGGDRTADFRVATSFVHPTRGGVRCPAADMVAGWLEHTGAEVVKERFGSVALDAPADGPPEAGWATTYLDPEGLAVGIAVTSTGHRQVAEMAVRLWTRAMRTRRVLLVPACDRCFGESWWPSALPGSGSGSGADGRPGSERLNGDTPRCPHRLVADRLTDDYTARGDTVVVVGLSGPRGPSAAVGQRTAVTGVATVEDARRLQPPDPDRLSFVLSPCTPVEPAAEILDVLRRRFPGLRGQHPDQWCYAESDFRAAAASVAAASDLLLTVGHGPSPVPEIPGLGERHRHIDGLGDVHPADLASAATVGLIEHGPDGGHLTGQILTALSGLGPLGVVHRQHRTERYDIRPDLRIDETSHL